MKLSFGELLKKKATQLLLPCVTWGAIGNIALTATIGSNLSLIETIVVNFWFLKSVFYCYILFWLANRVGKVVHSEVLGVLMALTVSVVCSSFDSPRLFPCFIIGAYFNSRNYFAQCHKTLLWLVTPIFIVLLYYWSINKNIWLDFGSVTACIRGDFSWSEFLFKYLYRILIGVSGSLMIICLIFSFFKQSENKIFKGAARIGQCTLGIYIVQTYILERIIPKLISLNGNTFTDHFLITPIISFIILVICYYIVKIIRLNKFTSILLLGETNK